MTTFDRPLQLNAIHENLERLDRKLREDDTQESAIQLLQEICKDIEEVHQENVTTCLKGDITASPESSVKTSCLQRWFTGSISAVKSLLNRNQIDAAGSPNSEKEEYYDKKIFLEKTLKSQRNDRNDTLAHTAATYHSDPKFLEVLIKKCPSILLEERKGPVNGQTPLHIVIAGEKKDMVKTILDQNKDKNYILEKLLTATANGSKFKDTVMLGQLPLSVAALTLNRKIVEMLLESKANIKEENEDRETVFHSLIRYASTHVDKSDDIRKMIVLLNKEMQADRKMQADNKNIWYECENKDRLTPLKLAASLGLEKLFSDILKLEGVYRSVNRHRGVSGVYLYDITEIDTITQAESERYTGTAHNGEKNEETNQPKLRHKSPAVLEIICQLKSKHAFPFLYEEVIKEIIRSKWRHYKRFFYAWAILHFLIMVHITTLVVYKTDVIYPSNDVNMTGVINTTGIGRTKKDFVDASAGLTIVYALIYVFLELIRWIYFRQEWHFKAIHHNGPYRSMLTIFSLALIIDATWYYIHPQNNYFLILAFIMGWTFMIFFLRTFKKFSFFTTMCLKIVVGDLYRLSLLIFFQLLGFLTAIYITYRYSRDPPPGFENYFMASVTMFKVMLGLAELDFLYEARESWLALGLYLAFVFVFYVTLINSLIAMMSRTCGIVSEDRYQQWKLQRLSVILLLETMLVPEYRHLPVIDRDELDHYSMEIQPCRFYLEITDTTTLKNYYDPLKVYVHRHGLDILLSSLKVSSTFKRILQANNTKWTQVDRPCKEPWEDKTRTHKAKKRHNNINWQFQELYLTRTYISSTENC